jgi:hypothetical protein
LYPLQEGGQYMYCNSVKSNVVHLDRGNVFVFAPDNLVPWVG